MAGCAAGSASGDEPAAHARSGFGVERGGDPAMRLPDLLRQPRELGEVLLAIAHLLPPAGDVDAEDPVEVLGAHVDALQLELLLGRHDPDGGRGAGDLAV